VEKVLHLISGGDVGGAKTHVLTLVKELQKSMPVKIICFMEGLFAQEAREMGIDIMVLPQNRRYDLKVVGTLVDIIKDEGFTLIHSHGARANFITRFVKKRIPIPCVTTIHSDFMLDFKGNLYKHIIYTNLNIFALKKFDYFIAVSQSFKNMLIGRGFPEERIFTVYNGIDFDEKIEYKSRESFLAERGLSHLKDKKIIGILARLHPVKGHEVLIDAVSKIMDENYEVHVLITGEASELPELNDKIKKLGLEKNIHFIGFVDRPYDFLNAIDINVLTSYSESFPYVLLEGARLKKPTIASAVGGIPMLIDDGVNGYLFKAGDANELGRKLSVLIKDEVLCKAFGEALYIKASNNYSLKNLASKHMEIYNKVAESVKK